MQSSHEARELVSVVDLKKLARTRLPSSSALRDLILSEPDYLPDEEVRIKVKMYSRLLYRELNRPSS
ncbi:MAG: hypothetical protein OK454_01755 [Thaumarchaeota archaeon]|nr:hypothetical protein [Nitrososphaerota archaeon]